MSVYGPSIAKGQDMAQPIVSAQGLERVFSFGSQEIKAIHDVDLEIQRGQFVAIIGRSGAGKTTLLNLIAGLDRPTSGVVYIEGEDITKLSEDELTELRRHRIGFVFQSFGLLSLLSAYENVELPLRIAGVSGAERGRRAQECLELVGLGGRANHRPYELSGGEQQRVAIARAMVNRPPIILADEPTGELDSATASVIFALLRGIVDEEGVTIITATHDPAIIELASVVRELSDGTFVNHSP